MDPVTSKRPGPLIFGVTTSGSGMHLASGRERHAPSGAMSIPYDVPACHNWIMWSRVMPLVVASQMGCADEKLDPFEDPSRDPCIPTVAGPSPIVVHEGTPTTFDLMLVEPFTCGIGTTLRVWTLTHPIEPATVTIEPNGLTLTPSTPTQSVTLTATPDTDTVDASYELEAYVWGAIGNESPHWQVDVIDGDPDPM